MFTRGTALLALTLSCFAAADPANGQTQQQAEGLSVTGSVRLRYETIEGQARAGFNSDDTLFNIRTQILAEYRGDDVRIGAELFDSRAYNANAGTPISTNEVNTFELVQAYVAGDIAEPLGKAAGLRLPRAG